MEVLIDRLISLRDLLSQHSLFALGMLLVFGYLLGKLATKIHLPEITGFIIAGLVMGEAVTGIIPIHMGEDLKIVTEVALGLIALTIGGEFYWLKLKQVGKEVIIITVIQLLSTFLIVSIALFLFQFSLPFAIILGAIASATAPAATVAIVQSLRAHGLFIDYLYGVVALDDAGAVILFGIIFSIATSFLGTAADAASGAIIFRAFAEVGLSLLIGLIVGGLVHIATKKLSNHNEVLIITLGLIFLATAVAIIFHLSPLLTNMAAGAILINLSARNNRIFRIIEPLTPPIYALFFVIAGTELRPEIIIQSEVLLLGLVFILSRAAGKYGGVYLACNLTKTDKRIRNYLGFCMLPQAGVAIGLVLLIQASPLMTGLSAENMRFIEITVNVILFSVFINELIGPPISKYAVVKGNEMEE